MTQALVRDREEVRAPCFSDDKLEHALSMSCLSRVLPRRYIGVMPAHVAHEGWVYKKSLHLKLWRSRWMILTVDRQLLTFEGEQQSKGATGHFLVNSEAAGSAAPSAEGVL